MPADALEQDILEVLGQHLSELTARSVVSRARRDLRSGFCRDRLPDVVAAMERGLRLFAGREQCRDLEQRLLALGPPRSAPRSRLVPIGSEQDVVAARLMARDVCLALGCRALLTQRVATAVSELARNISLYAGSGGVTFDVLEDPTRLRVVAEDRGPGIADVALVMSGDYRSKTGMGRGLAGVKRLADDFTLRTGAGGTRVEIQFQLAKAIA